MKYILVAVLAGLCAFAFAQSDFEQGRQHYKIGGNDYIRQYKDILTLFKYVQQPTFYKQHVNIAKEYSIHNNISGYTNPQAVKEFLSYYNKGMLPRDEVFSVFYDYHLKQAVALFKLFYYARDFETFYKTACWARYYINQGMFLYSFSVALIHRPDTYSMVLPPIYEIYPYYFFNNEVIQKAQQYKQMWSNTDIQQHEYTVPSNYSGYYLNVHPEQYMSYFTEDVGINAYYYYYNLYRPFWMNSEEFGIITYQRGEEFYYFYQQFLARYYLERLSNSFGEIPTYDYEAEFETGYYPSMCYPNGINFPQRHNWARFIMNFYNWGQSFSMKGQYPYSYRKVVEYERRIRDAIDAGFIYTEDGQKIRLFEPQGFNTLGNIIESNLESVNTRFYGYLQIFTRHLLGYSFQPLNQYKVAPSALEHFETSLRDPAFWQLYKRIILYFQKYKYQLPRYTFDELSFPGVKIEDMQVDRLVTYFEPYDIDITNAVYMNKNEFEHNNFKVNARQYRLNHKPFTYKIHVVSEKPTQAVVRVFIGPKYDEFGRFIELDENRLNFVELDRFKYELKSGKNVIERNSQQVYYSQDRTTYKQLYQYAMTGEQFSTHETNFYYTFPNRFLIPKGKYGGQTFQFYVIVSPYKSLNMNEQKHQVLHKQTEGYQRQHYKYPMVGLGVQYMDAYPLGYPFDKPIDEYNFYVPNSYFQDVVIHHNNERNGIYSVSDRVTTLKRDYESEYYPRRQYEPKYETYQPKYYEKFDSKYNEEYEPKHQEAYEPKYQPHYHYPSYQYSQGYDYIHRGY